MQVMQENMKGIQGGRYFWCSTNKLIIHDIYFIGEKLMIHNLNDGLKINFTRLRASNIVSRFKRAVSRFKRSSR
jgi:hypothetical protein